MLEKIVPKEEEAVAGSAKKPAAPVKGKPAASEDVKPVYAKAWLDLRPLLHSGAKSFHQNIFLQPLNNFTGASNGRATPA